ncbi:MAG: hypothetical protein KBA64_06890 [Armatimonadetes bacterium]|jgi:hypothetical protein|nr:hypothetical protein [Armatimonadota bacterium]MDI9602405.1 hypothetical protein [Acidobacteriota bacterium]
MAAETLPEPLRCIGAYLETFTPPNEPFDPVGEWTHTYSIRLIHQFQGVQHCDAVGVLRLIRSQLGVGVIRISVAHAPRQAGPGWDRVDATLSCADDRLSSLRAWDSKTRLVRNDGVVMEGTEFRARGVVERGRIVRISGGKIEHPAQGPVTTDWGLIDAVQRLPLEPARIEDFTVLEELDAPRLGQRLVYCGPVEVPTASGAATLHGFERAGRGVLPTTYWVDEEHRMWFAIGSLRAVLLEPGLQVPEVKDQ